jgi:hypothetical protein
MHVMSFHIRFNQQRDRPPYAQACPVKIVKRKDRKEMTNERHKNILNPLPQMP